MARNSFPGLVSAGLLASKRFPFTALGEQSHPRGSFCHLARLRAGAGTRREALRKFLENK